MKKTAKKLSGLRKIAVLNARLAIHLIERSGGEESSDATHSVWNAP